MIIEQRKNQNEDETYLSVTSKQMSSLNGQTD